MAGKNSRNNADDDVASRNQGSVVNDLRECEDCGHLVPAQNMVVHGLRACQPRKRPAHQENTLGEEQEPRKRPAYRENNMGEEQEQPSARTAPLLSGMASFPPAAASAPPAYDADTTTAISSEPPHYDNVAVLPPPATLLDPPSFHGVEILAPPSPQNLSNVNSNEPPVEHEDGDWVVVPRQSPGESMSNTNSNGPMVAADSDYPSTNNIFKQIADAWERWTSCGAGDSHDNENTRPYPARRDAEGRQGSNLSSTRSSNNNRNNTVAAATWTCPQCTLHNATTRQKCEACLFRNPTLRAPDAVRRGERLSGQSQRSEQQNANANNAPVDYLSGGAILGGVVGVAGAALMGQNPVVGLLEGAMNGAFTGAMVGSTVHAREQIEEQQRMAASASHGRGGPVRVDRRQMPNGSMMVLSRPGGQRLLVNDPLESAMMESLMMGDPAGTGSDNLGANQAQIQALPSSKIQDPNRLPEDGQECPICLESFRKGTTRKTLPCLHGFHNKCVDQWLRTNASCPICKHSIAS